MQHTEQKLGLYTVLCIDLLPVYEQVKWHVVHAARALNNKKNIMLTMRTIAENIAESIAYTYIGETYGQNSEVNVRTQW